MLRLFLSVCSAFVLVAFYFFLAGVQPSLAAEEKVLAAGNPPLTRQTADASAQVTFFMLQVVANGDADLDLLDRQMLDGWASALASSYSALPADDQQMLAGMPALRSALVEAWPQASASDKEVVREAFRPMAQAWLADLSCDTYVTFAESGLVEPTSGNLARYKGCDSVASLADDDYDYDDEDDEVVSPAPAPAASASAAAPAASHAVPESPTAAYQRASAGLAASHNMYVNMSNVLTQNHVGNMNAILNMGNNDYHYVYKP